MSVQDNAGSRNRIAGGSLAGNDSSRASSRSSSRCRIFRISRGVACSFFRSGFNFFTVGGRTLCLPDMNVSQAQTVAASSELGRQIRQSYRCHSVLCPQLGRSRPLNSQWTIRCRRRVDGDQSDARQHLQKRPLPSRCYKTDLVSSALNGGRTPAYLVGREESGIPLGIRVF